MEQLATTDMSIQNAEPSDVTAYLLQQCEDNRQAMTILARQKHSIYVLLLTSACIISYRQKPYLSWRKDIKKGFVTGESRP